MYDPSKSEVWNIHLYNHPTFVVDTTVPYQGYFVMPSAAHVSADERLILQGISYRQLKKPCLPCKLQTFEVSEYTFAPKSYEGRQTLSLKGAWKSTQVNIPVNTLFVPIAVAQAPLIMNLLEPQAPDSLAAWGYLNAYMEQKEGIEGYVIEPFAQEKLAIQRSAAFESFKKDASNANNPDKLIQFFHKMHPSWDENYRRLPIYRL